MYFRRMRAGRPGKVTGRRRWKRQRRARTANLQKYQRVQEIRRQPACWGNPLLQASQTIQIQLLQQESPVLTGTETAAAFRSREEAVPPTSAEAPTSPRVGMGKEEGQGDASGQGKEPVDYAAAAANGYRIYEIGDGETLYGICWKEYGNLKRLSEICSAQSLGRCEPYRSGARSWSCHRNRVFPPAGMNWNKNKEFNAHLLKMVYTNLYMSIFQEIFYE